MTIKGKWKESNKEVVDIKEHEQIKKGTSLDSEEWKLEEVDFCLSGTFDAIDSK